MNHTVAGLVDRMNRTNVTIGLIAISFLLYVAFVFTGLTAVGLCAIAVAVAALVAEDIMGD
jgi:hypothetical protein